MNINDKVIYTDTNGTDWDAVVLELKTIQIDGAAMVIISMDGGWPIYVPQHCVRLG